MATVFGPVSRWLRAGPPFSGGGAALHEGFRASSGSRASVARGPRAPAQRGGQVGCEACLGPFSRGFRGPGPLCGGREPRLTPTRATFVAALVPFTVGAVPISASARALGPRRPLALARRPWGSVRARTGRLLRTCCSRATPPAPRKNAVFPGNYGAWARSSALGPAQGRGQLCRSLRAALAALCNAVRAWLTARRALRRQPAGSRTAARHPRCACGCSRR